MYELIERYISSLISDCKPELPVWNIEAIKQGKKPAWNYIDGCMMISLINLYYQTGDRKYFDFVKNFIDYYVDDEGNILGYKVEEYNLDNINEGRVLFDLYAETKQEKYLLAIEKIYEQVKTQPKNSKGSFWHKKIYHDQVWLDGLFMAQIFYYRYQDFKGLDKEPIYQNFRNVEKYMKDKVTGLYFHGYDESKTLFWADKETGLSSNFWLRSLGWYISALSDITTYIPDGDKEKAEFIGYLKNAIDSVLKYMDKDEKMFYQVVDKKGVSGNYLETSGSALICYAILKAINNNLLDKNYLPVATDIFNGICKKYLKEDEKGLRLDGICLVAGLGPENKPRRDGSVEYYLSEPIVSTDAKGVAPFIMAYVELKKATL